MISKINWEALKETIADEQNHQLGETIYKHYPAEDNHLEGIIARLHKVVWICHKIGNRWFNPIRLYGVQNYLGG